MFQFLVKVIVTITSFSSFIRPPVVPPVNEEFKTTLFTGGVENIKFVGIVPEYKNHDVVEFVIEANEGDELVSSGYKNYTSSFVYGLDVFDKNNNKYYLVGDVICKSYRFAVSNLRYIYDYNSVLALTHNQLLINFINNYNITEYRILKKHTFEDIDNVSWFPPQN